MRKRVLACTAIFAMVLNIFQVPQAKADSAGEMPKPAYCWDFEELSGGRLANKGTAGKGDAVLEGSAGTDMDAVNVGGTSYKEKENKVLVLSGGAKGTSYVSLPSDMYQGVGADTGFTYSFWLKPDSSVGSYSRVISSVDKNSGNEFAFAPFAVDKVWNVLFDDTAVVHAPMPNEPEKDAWSFVVFTVNEEEITFYINGEKKGIYEDSMNLSMRLDSMETLVQNALGKTCSTWTDPDAKVKLDDLCLYKKALTQKEVVNLAREQGLTVGENPEETTEKGGANELTDGTEVTDTGLSVSYQGITAKITEHRETGRFFITADKNGKVLLDASQLGVKTSVDFTRGMYMVSGSEKTISGEDAYSLTTGAKRKIVDAYQELSFQLKKEGADDVMTVFVRLYKDGIAYRYEWHKAAGEKETIYEEASEFVLPADASVWAGYDEAGNYEYSYRKMKMSTIKENTAKYCVPLLANSGDNWMLLTEAAVFSEEDTYCASHLATNAGTRNLKFTFGKGSGSSISMTYNEDGIVHTPWRAAIMTDNLNDIVNATMISSLNPDADASLYQDGNAWIKTGTVAWSWWSEAGDSPIEYGQQKDYIDFAAENGWEYVCLDFGWCLWKDYKNKVKELVDYGKEKGVGILLWYGVNNDNHSGFRDAQGNAAYPTYSLKTAQQLEEQFAWCEEVGVRGVKVDYYENDDKDTMTQMYECATTAARHKINVLFHGCTAPRGEIRTFPNVLGYEAVQGSEWYKWNCGPSAANCLLYVFNRNVVGGMDFTPVGTQVGQVPLTAGFQLAQVIAYQTGLQNIASSVYKLEGYGGLSMINDVPTQWDETVLLNGNPGKKVTIARRNGEDWYVAAMTAAAGNEKISLDFLGDGTYRAYIYKDNETGSDVVIDECEVTKDSELSLSLAANGGAAIKITKGEMKTTTAYDPYTYYEAEDTNNTLGGNAVISENQFASGMKQVTGIGSATYNKLTFNKVNVPEDGVYEMRLYYACNVNRRVVYAVNEKKEVRSGQLSAGVNTLAMHKFYVALNKGENTISFGNPTLKAPDVDRIAISDKPVQQAETETDLTGGGKPGKPTDGAQYDYTLYEPGTAVLSGGARVEDNAIVSLGSNAACKAVFKVEVQQGGTYRLQINYFSAVTRTIYLSANGGEKSSCICPSTGSNVNDSADTVYVDVVLKAGENSIEFGNPKEYCPNIVSIGISKTCIPGSETDTPNSPPGKDPVVKPGNKPDDNRPETANPKKILVKIKGYENSKITLVKGSSIKLATSVVPSGASQKVIFTTSKKSLATVSAKGIIKAKKAGIVKISVISADKKIKKNITIRIVNKKRKNTRLALKKNSAVLNKKSQTVNIGAKSLTKNTTDKITYRVISGKGLVKVDAYGAVSVKSFKSGKSAVVRVRCGKAVKDFKIKMKSK